MKIGVFVDQPTTDVQNLMVAVLDKDDLVFTVDAIHRRNLSWLAENFPVEDHQLFFIHEEGHWHVRVNVPQLERPPDMVVYFNHDEIITEEDLLNVGNYFKALLDGNKIFVVPRINEFLLTCRKSQVELFPFETNLPPVTGQEQVYKDGYHHKLTIQEGDGFYSFDHKHYEREDLCLAQVRKPFTDRPYTVVIRKFSQNGFLHLFSSLYLIDSWGADTDNQFLKHLWDELEMEGTFDLDQILHDHCEKCFPGEGHVPISEPEVYRKTIEETMNEIQRKREGKCFFIDP